ncbi:Imm10 family immunity protein [Janthinobacterium sp. Mn2066]|uniref:Imm10 family immunity protein n=1 Tax=Janthinobacterium sp. Mn2066 TaxID=3395264 RepID=UPI003BCBCE8B
MSAGFTATELSILNEDDALITTLAANTAGSEPVYLMFQRAATDDEQDAELGMDEPYIEFGGQEFAWYGHMHAVILHPNRLSVQLDAEAAMQMDDDGQLDVRFNFTPEQFAQLQQALRTTFDGCEYYREER